jgi:chromate transporter
MPRPSLAALTGVFFKVGNTTFGGGPPTMAALQREFVDRHGWLTQEEYGLSFALARVTPGTNVMAFCAATGWQILGWVGAIAGTFSVTLPSAVIAVLITVGYENWRTNPLALAAINGTVAAVAGMMLATVYSLVKPHMGASGSQASGMSLIRSVRAIAISGGAFLALWKFGLTPLQIIALVLVVGLLWRDPADREQAAPRQPLEQNSDTLPAQERAP